MKYLPREWEPLKRVIVDVAEKRTVMKMDKKKSTIFDVS